jgi:hypothetical protein
MRSKLKGRRSPMKGKTHTAEAKEKNRKAHLYIFPSEETRELLSKQNSIPVYQFTINNTFIAKYSSRLEAARITKANDTQIARCILGRPNCKTAGGFIWKNYIN